MNRFNIFLIFLITGVALPAFLRAQREPVLPTVKEVATGFKNPEAKYSPSILWGWEGNITREVIDRDLKRFKSLNIGAVNIEAGYDLPVEYLSDGYFDLIKYAVEQARSLGMVVWMIDESKYPSGFAGGKFSRERPDLRMQGLDFWKRMDVPSGKSFSEEVPPVVLSAVAVEKNTGESRLIPIRQGRITWTVPPGEWQVWMVRYRFRTSVTRAGNNPTHGKDTMNALCDYLNPEAVYQFIRFTHEQYKKHVGNHFGTTFLGFRGDEPDYGFVPWTGELPMAFQMKKGYDVRPWVAGFLVKNPTDSMLRVKADYWDVWSDLFAENFFKVQADWCAANGISYMTHLNHEDQMMALARSGGDFFKSLRNVQIPGVDAIWNQIWPGKSADFPKYAASVAHVNGKQFALSESFAAYNTPPNAREAKWVTDHQLVRGINKFEWMYWPASSKGPDQPRGWFGDSRFPTIAQYTARSCYLLSQGRPAADFAVYYPTPSLWMGYAAADSSTLQLTRFLLGNQRDFDFIDDYAIEHGMRLTHRGFRNWSGQEYKVILVPAVVAMSDLVLDRLKAFTNRGGKVIFTGTLPSLIVRKNFRKAISDYDFSPMFRASGLQILSYLPDPDFRLKYSTPDIKYNHRTLADGELYFIFNEGDKEVDNAVTLNGSGSVSFWNPETGDNEPCQGTLTTGNLTELPLKLAPWETKVIVVQR